MLGCLPYVTRFDRHISTEVIHRGLAHTTDISTHTYARQHLNPDEHHIQIKARYTVGDLYLTKDQGHGSRMNKGCSPQGGRCWHFKRKTWTIWNSDWREDSALSALSALSEDKDWVLCTHMVVHSIRNSSPRGSDALLWPPGVLNSCCAHVYV